MCNCRTQHLVKVLGINWLCKMGIHPCIRAFLNIVIESIRRHRNDRN